MTKARPHLRARTTVVLNALASFGPGGATAAQIGKRARVRPQQASASLRWLKRGGLARYDAGRWYMADDRSTPLFPEAAQ